MKTTKLILATSLSFIATWANSYELATHAATTYNAYLKSNLVLGGTLVKDFGIEVLLVNPDTSGMPFGENYYDIQGSTIMERKAQDYEKNVIKPIPRIDISPLTLSGWLMRGAIREDDLGTVLGFRKGDDPHDDPYGSIFRVYNHFFDPIHNIPLTVLHDELGETTPNWAIGTTDAFATPMAENIGRRNHFTVFDARETMYRALTGQSKNGTNLGNNLALPAPEVDRKKYWATLFRALGDILHLNQDMAQPQHTRNEAHTGLGGPLSNSVTGHESVFEMYIDARATGSNSYSIDGLPKQPYPPLDFGNYDYPIPAFNKISDYWSSGIGATSLSGKGLADYSNHGFFTTGNNIGGTKFAAPSPIAANYVPQRTLYPEGMAKQFIMNYLAGPVVDNNTGNQTNPDSIRMVRESIWKEFSTASNVYSLDRNTYDDMANLLIPRAVSYSAGLINYLFRGQMKISLPDEGVYSLVDHSSISIADPLHEFKGFNKIKLKLANTTPNGEAMPAGKLTAVLKFHRNKCYKNDLSGYPPFVDWNTCRTDEEEIVVSNPANGGADVALTETSQPFAFDFTNALPLNATDVYLQLVYRGKLGVEDDAVVVATQDISEPTFFSYLNASDYIHIGNTVYTRNEVNTLPGVIGLVSPQSLVDNTLAPPQLRPDSLLPAPYTLDIWFDSQGTTRVHVDNLQAGQFIRVVFLGKAPLLGSDRTPIPTLATDMSGPCHPNDFSVGPMEWQKTFDPSTNTLMTWHPRFERVRGVPGFDVASCVYNGDGSPSGTQDDRDQKMVAAAYDNPSPVPVQINGGPGF